MLYNLDGGGMPAGKMRVTCWAALLASCALAQQPGPYNPDPNHIWNRVHRVLHVRVADDGREYGLDELDPLLWLETNYLLTGESHRRALAVLDEFLASHAERLIADPLRRAIFQRDLWAIFDWSDNTDPRHGGIDARRALQVRLARLMQRVALTTAEIERLPDNFTEAAEANVLPNLPDGLFKPEGPWVPLIPRGGEPAALAHTSGFGGRSVFHVFLQLPGGREETLAYLKRLSEYPEPWVLKRDTNESRIVPSPLLPQFASRTQVVLMRRMMLLDHEGNVVPTHLTELLQIRAYAGIGATDKQENSEFRLSREKLFAHQAGGLRVIGPDDRKFSVFMTQGNDAFEPLHRHEGLERSPPVLETCVSCHRESGIYSVLTYTHSLKTLIYRPPELKFWSPTQQAMGTVYWKQRQHDLGLLQGLWPH
jgi:hypothetical protein